MKNDKALITVDIRSTRPHLGKTLLHRVLWYGLKKLGYDPTNELVSVDCLDKDLDLSMYNRDLSGDTNLEVMLREAVAKMNEGKVQVHLIDLNLPAQLHQSKAAGQSYQVRTRENGGQYGDWTPCSLEAYLDYLSTPILGDTERDIRSFVVRPTGPQIQISEQHLADIAGISKDLERISELLDYDTSYAGETKGTLKRLLRANEHAMRRLLNEHYHDGGAGVVSRASTTK